MGRKRIYLGLMVLSLFLFIACTAMIWRVSYRGLQEIHPFLPFLFGAVIILFSASAALLTLLLAISLSFRKGTFTGEKALHMWIRILYPFSLGLGGILGIDKDRIERSFIEVNNYLVQSGKPKYLFKDILLLMPHCLQDSECPVRITHEVKNCRSCGRCNVADLLAIAEARGAHLRVASGGTSARRFVLEFQDRLLFGRDYFDRALRVVVVPGDAIIIEEREQLVPIPLKAIFTLQNCFAVVGRFCQVSVEPIHELAMLSEKVSFEAVPINSLNHWSHK